MISDFVTISVKKIPPESIVFTRKTWGYCRMPYPDHPNGCPNFGKNPNCPPNSKYMEEIKEKYKYFYLIYANFDFRGYKDERKKNLLKRYNEGIKTGKIAINTFEKRLKSLTEKNLGNLLYWQRPVKILLKNKVKTISNKEFDLLGCGSGFWEGIYSMESAGIDVYSTLKNNNILFEERPADKIILVSLIYMNEKIVFEKKKITLYNFA